MVNIELTPITQFYRVLSQQRISHPDRPLGNRTAEPKTGDQVYTQTLDHSIHGQTA